MADPKLIDRKATKPFPLNGRISKLEPVPELFEDFIEYSQRACDSLDYDPFHPMIWHLGKGLDRERLLWLCTLYMAYYSIGSTWVAFVNCDYLKMPPEWVLKLPIGVQRRNLRGGTLRNHLEDFIKQAKAAGSIWKLLTARFSGMELEDWGALTHNVGSIWGNGRWSTYTTSELYQKVGKVPVLPRDIMNDGSTGPRTGLCYLYGLKPPLGLDVVPALDRLAHQTFRLAGRRLKTRIPYLQAGHYDMGMLESALCDFNSLRKGRYYVGRDVDRDLDRLRATRRALRCLGRPDGALSTVMEARASVFLPRHLGERTGWEGRTDYALEWYKKHGQVADHLEIIEARRGNGIFF